MSTLPMDAAVEPTVPTYDVADVRYASRYYLGQEIEDAALAPGLLDGCVTAEQVRDVMYREAIARGRPVAPPMAARYTMFSPSAKKMVVLGNCQGPNLARAISAITDISVFGMEVMGFTEGNPMFSEALESADYVVAPLLGAQWGAISTERLKASGCRSLVTYSLMHFDGLHPDMTYWGSRADRVPSAVGDYHSRIVLQSFLRGLSATECLHSFTPDKFAELGFAEFAGRSFEEMERREQSADLKIADFLRSRYRREPTFFTFNHPRQVMFDHLAQQICTWFDLPTHGWSAQIAYNHLAYDVIWPIYRELDAMLGIRFAHDERYCKNTNVMTREEFVWRSYQHYAAVDRDYMLQSGSPDQRAGIRMAP